MTAFRDFLPEILPHVPGASDPVAVQAVRNAVRQFCRITLLLSHENAAQDVVADQPLYTVTAPVNRVVVKATRARFDGNDLLPYSEDQFDLDAASERGFVFPSHNAEPVFPAEWRTVTNAVPTHFYQPQPDKLRLVGIPSAAKTGALVVIVAVMPSMSAAEVDDFIADSWYEAIACGAKSLLLKMPRKDWTDLVLGRALEGDFFRYCHDAHAEKIAGFARDDKTVGHVQAYP